MKSYLINSEGLWFLCIFTAINAIKSVFNKLAYMSLNAKRQFLKLQNISL